MTVLYKEDLGKIIGEDGKSPTLKIGTVERLGENKKPYVTIEPEEDNSYILNFGLPGASSGSGGNGSAGITILADELGDLASLACDDSMSENVIHKSTSSSVSGDGIIAEFTIEGLPLGSYSIATRMRTSNKSNSNNFLKVVVYSDETQLKETFIKPTYFSTANIWEMVSFGVNFVGTRESIMRIKFVEVANSTSFTYDVDYITVLQSGTALGSIG